MVESLPRLSLTLASQSPARLSTLRNAGFDPRVEISFFDEDSFLSSRSDRISPSASVLALATEKARDVARRMHELGGKQWETDFIVGCDSMFEFEGEIYGKPHSPEAAKERLMKMRGNTGILHTGHCLIHAPSGRSVSAVSHAKLSFAPMSEAFIDAYIATSEPLEVAGSFTADGLGGSFIDDIEGDYHGVVGISLPLLRKMFEYFDVSITQLWAPPASPEKGEISSCAQDLLSGNRDFHLPRGADGFMLCACGHKHWGLAGAAGVLAFREHAGKHQVLLQLRSPWSHAGNTWGFPGGAIDWEEDIQSGALREFCEETSINSSDLTFVDTYHVDHGDWDYTTFIARYDGDSQPHADAESIEVRWVDIEDVESLKLLPSFANAWPHLQSIILRG